jgi:hypothetical protein
MTTRSKRSSPPTFWESTFILGIEASTVTYLPVINQ